MQLMAYEIIVFISVSKKIEKKIKKQKEKKRKSILFSYISIQ